MNRGRLENNLQHGLLSLWVYCSCRAVHATSDMFTVAVRFAVLFWAELSSLLLVTF